MTVAISAALDAQANGWSPSRVAASLPLLSRTTWTAPRARRRALEQHDGVDAQNRGDAVQRSHCDVALTGLEALDRCEVATNTIGEIKLRPLARRSKLRDTTAYALKERRC
jgi:hypothetical protein